jgi:hypothetical protein
VHAKNIIQVVVAVVIILGGLITMLTIALYIQGATFLGATASALIADRALPSGRHAAATTTAATAIEHGPLPQPVAAR